MKTSTDILRSFKLLQEEKQRYFSYVDRFVFSATTRGFGSEKIQTNIQPVPSASEKVLQATGPPRLSEMLKNAYLLAKITADTAENE